MEDGVHLDVIYLIVTRDHSYTFRDIPLDPGNYTLIFYDALEDLINKPAGPVIFTDHDRLTTIELEKACKLYSQLKEQHPQLTILNDPNEVLLRYDLLKKLYQEKINSFNIYRPDDDWSTIRFPVFVRSEHIHTYAKGLGLAANVEQLNRNISNHLNAGFNSEKLIITEFCNISDSDGIFNKYAAYFLDGEVVPRHLYYARNWYVAGDSMKESANLNIERYAIHAQYMKTNPHESWIRKIFARAAIDYGRIDYGVRQKVPQVWEINLNPNFSTNVNRTAEPGSFDAKRLQLFETFDERFRVLLEKLNDPASDELFTGISEV